MNFLSDSGFWFAIGIVVGLLIDIGGRFFFEWWFRPQLSVSLDGLCPVVSSATVPSAYRRSGQARPPTEPVTVMAYRFKVCNAGRSAAQNVAGTLEFDAGERRICWYEGNVAHLTINAHDHSYLDAYGVILDGQGNPTTGVVFPIEHGWDNLSPIRVEKPLKVRLRVTAADAECTKMAFAIDPAQGGIPIGA